MSGSQARELLTPEGVPLRLELADAGERVVAFVVDVGGMLVLVLALSLGSALLFKGVDGEVAGVVLLLGFFLLRNFYFAMFELQPRAATPGKRLLGIRVAARNGERLTADAILARNLMRELELFLPLSILVLASSAGLLAVLLGLSWALLFGLLPLFNRDRLRVGDLLAGTWVVRVPRRRLLPELAGAGAGRIAFTAAQLGVYGVKELQVLEDVLRVANPETLALVAARIAGKIGWTRADETDAAFLQAYYAGLRGRLERGMLFGLRKRDKLDPVSRTPPPLGGPPPRPGGTRRR